MGCCVWGTHMNETPHGWIREYDINNYDRHKVAISQLQTQTVIHIISKYRPSTLELK